MSLTCEGFFLVDNSVSDVCIGSTYMLDFISNSAGFLCRQVETLEG